MSAVVVGKSFFSQVDRDRKTNFSASSLKRHFDINLHFWFNVVQNKKKIPFLVLRDDRKNDSGWSFSSLHANVDCFFDLVLAGRWTPVHIILAKKSHWPLSHCPPPLSLRKDSKIVVLRQYKFLSVFFLWLQFVFIFNMSFFINGCPFVCPSIKNDVAVFFFPGI